MNRGTGVRRTLIAAAVAAMVMGVTAIAASPADARGVAPVEIVATVTSPTFTGTWTSSGAIDDSGTFARTDLHFSGSVEHSPTVGAFQVVITFTGDDGTFSIRDELRFSSAGLTGTWQVASGTGAYERLSGHGTSEFSFETGSVIFTGVLSTKTA